VRYSDRLLDVEHALKAEIERREVQAAPGPAASDA
jgi:hypothetical protein